MDFYNTLIMSDAHWPYHDLRAYDITLEISKDIPELHEITLNGDMQDCLSLSLHPKNPRFTATVETEYLSVRDRLQELRVLHPNVKMTYLEGNHENRLKRYLGAKAPELYGMIKAEDLMGLTEYDVSWVSYSKTQKHHINEHLITRHKPISSGENHVSGTLKRALCNVMYGHLHKRAESSIVSLDGQVFKAMSLPCLADKNHAVMDYNENPEQWQLGFSIITTFPKLGLWFHTPVDILYKGRKAYAVYQDKIYSS